MQKTVVLLAAAAALAGVVDLAVHLDRHAEPKEAVAKSIPSSNKDAILSLRVVKFTQDYLKTFYRMDRTPQAWRAAIRPMVARVTMREFEETLPYTAFMVASWRKIPGVSEYQQYAFRFPNLKITGIKVISETIHQPDYRQVVAHFNLILPDEKELTKTKWSAVLDIRKKDGRYQVMDFMPKQISFSRRKY